MFFSFPISHFGVLFGFIQFAAGVAGLLQYPLFEWSGAYVGSFDHVSFVLPSFPKLHDSPMLVEKTNFGLVLLPF